MANAIKFDSTGGGDAFLDYIPAMDQIPFYLAIEAYIPAATLAAWDPTEGTGPAMLLAFDSLGGQIDIVYPFSNSGTVFDEWGDNQAANITTPPAADAWLTVKMNRDLTGGYYQVDADQQTYIHSPLTLHKARVGMDFGVVGVTVIDGIVWVRSIKAGTADGLSDLIDFDATTAPDLSPFTLTGAVTLAPFTPTPPPPPINIRFFEGFPWRYIVTDLNTETITFLDRLATNRQVHLGRNQPREMSGAVPSDNPEINILHTDGDPFLNEGNRLLYAFRREGAFGPGPTWVCRGAGPILFTDDAAQTDQPLTRFNAYDPWKLLYKRPLRLADGTLPGPLGRVFLAGAWTYQQIAFQLLTDSIAFDGPCFIDPTGGTIVDGPAIAADLTLQQGQSIGDCWDTLCATGNIDIELAPVYDPVGSPGICVTFNAKPLIGAVQNAAVFAWDLPSRSLVDISKAKDGTGRANTIQYYFGQGGPPVSLQTDAVSVAKYGEYFEQQFWPGFREAGPVTALAARRLQLVRDGAKTYTFSPAPERSPIPLLEYNPGDWCPFYASKKLREPLNPVLVSGVWQNIPRIEALTLDIADNQTETVTELLTSLEVQPT